MSVSSGNDINQLTEVIKELSQQLKSLSGVMEPFQQTNREETERFERYKTDGTSLEFNLVTGGLVAGKINWLGNQCISVRIESGRDVILYKHAISFIQE